MISGYITTRWTNNAMPGECPLQAMVREARQAIDGIAAKVRSSVNMLDAGSQGTASENRAKLIAAMNHVLYSECAATASLQEKTH